MVILGCFHIKKRLRLEHPLNHNLRRGPQHSAVQNLLRDFIFPSKYPSESALRKWRNAVSLVRTPRRRFRFVPDLDNRSENRNKILETQDKIRTLLIAYKAALRYIDDVPGEHRPALDSKEPSIENGLSKGTREASLGVDPDKLASLVHTHDLKALGSIRGVEGIAAKLKVSLQEGVKSSDIPTRQKIYGVNKYTEKPSRSFWMFVWEALHNLTLIILMVCSVISIGIGLATEGFPKGMYNGLGFILSIFMVTAVSAYKQSLQFKDLDKEKKKIFVHVTRDGLRQKVSIFDLVVGDVVHLSIGDVVPADGVFISGYNLVVDESSVSGESKQRYEIGQRIIYGYLLSMVDSLSFSLILTTIMNTWYSF